ncbi:MAG: hypothetical protein KC502_18750 [Myxococcales bacterium]|nr:hypothetical protein [Myxococcales bacterium]
MRKKPRRQPLRLVILGICACGLLYATTTGDALAKSRGSKRVKRTKTAASDPAGIVARNLASDIATSVSQIRGIPITRPLRVRVYDKKALTSFVRRQLTSHGGKRYLGKLERALRQVGLIRSKTGLFAAYIALLQDQVAGLYDPKARELRVMRHLVPVGVQLPNPLHLLTGSPEDQLRFVMAHEIVHALQDQRWKLGKLAKDRRGETDLEIALSSLFEGDATLGGLLWAMADRGGVADIKGLVAAERAIAVLLDTSLGLAKLGLLPGGKGLATAPLFLQERLVVPYSAGLSLCLAAVRRTGSYRGVDLLYAAPPLSTEQVLHPAKLWQQPRDNPVILRLPSVARHLGRGAKRIYQDNLGELLIRALLRTQLSADAANRAAAGWGGDRYALYRNRTGDSLIWMTTWDHEKDAVEFASALNQWLKAEVNAGATAGFVRRKGVDVVLLRGVAAPAVVGIVRRIFRHTRRRVRSRLPR